MMDLFDIACKLTKFKKQTRIEFGKINDKSVFVILGNRTGFDMKYAKILFGDFQRIHKSSEFPVTCIGLATVQQIIHSYSGHIWAETELDNAHTEVFIMKDSS